MCAYALARTEFRGRRLVASSTLLIYMVPPAVLAVPAFFKVITFSQKNDLAVLIFSLHCAQPSFRHLAPLWFLQTDPGGRRRVHHGLWCRMGTLIVIPPLQFTIFVAR